MPVLARYFFFPLVLSLLAWGCGSSSGVRLRYLNHPAMDLQVKRTRAPVGMLSGLDSVSEAQSSGVCSTCVK